MSRLRVNVSQKMKSWVDTRVAQGRHIDASDYIRDLLRRDQDASIDYAGWLHDFVAESGNADPNEVMRTA